jgi:hypothetical protein
VAYYSKDVQNLRIGGNMYEIDAPEADIAIEMMPSIDVSSTCMPYVVYDMYSELQSSRSAASLVLQKGGWPLNQH